MAQEVEREREEGTKSVEFLIIVLTYFTTLKDIPSVARRSGLTSWCPDGWKQNILAFWPYPDGIIMLLYTVLLIFLWHRATLLRPFKGPIHAGMNNLALAFSSKSDIARYSENLTNTFVQLRRRSTIRSFGTKFIIRAYSDWILGRREIIVYECFDWPDNWAPQPADRYGFVVRMLKSNGDGTEHQFKKDCKSLITRRHKEGTPKFEEPEESIATFEDFLIFSAISWKPSLWYLAHRVRRCFPKRPF